MFSSSTSVEHVSMRLLKLPLILTTAGNSCFGSSPTTHDSLHNLVVHACCCVLTCLTCQVPLRSSFANLLHSPTPQQTVRSHDGLRARAWRHYACCQDHSPKLMVLACRSWLHTCIHTYILTYMHTYIHACIHTYHLFTHHLSLSHAIFHIQLCPTQLFLLLDPSPPPLSFLPYPPRYNICCSLLEEVDMWGYPVR